VANLIVGPLLRYVSETEATIWVETDEPADVEVLGNKSRTFHVEGHHYAIVAVRGLEPGSINPYEVRIDGRSRWPVPGNAFPASAIGTLNRAEPLKLVFGSCRVAVPHDPPYSLTKDQDDRGREIDALYALALCMRARPRAEWPQVLMMLGDQIYADEDSPKTREFIRRRRDTSRAPGEGVADFEEYTRLYWESWRDPTLRWLFSTVSTVMIFDDHDVHDDWNTSAAWVETMRAKPWWRERITSALVSYWIYQHLGNLAPAELDESELLEQVRATPDAGPLLREWAWNADHSANGSRWSHARDLGNTRLIVLDSREGRVLSKAPRKIVDDEEWKWIESAASGDFEHLLIADTLPVLLSPGFHDAEAWNEALCDGAWGRAAAKLGERIRRALDLEHWAAFNDSFERMAGLLAAVGAGKRGPAPASIVMLAGDVHHAYLAEVAFRRGAGVTSAVYQAVCSPFRNPLDAHERTFARMGNSFAFRLLAGLLARAAGVRRPAIRWRLVQDPTFDNQFATLEISGDEMTFRIEKVVPGDWENPRIEASLERRLA